MKFEKRMKMQMLQRKRKSDQLRKRKVQRNWMRRQD